MKPILKLISTILLLVLVLEPVISPFVLQLHQLSVQHKMKERLEEEMLHTIIIAKTDLRWVKPGKEIVLGENMFDIKTMTDRGNGTLLITGIYDFEETLLVDHIKKSQQDDTANSNKQLVLLFHLIQALPGDEPEQAIPVQFISRNRYCTGEDALVSPFRNILTPPPRA